MATLAPACDFDVAAMHAVVDKALQAQLQLQAAKVALLYCEQHSADTEEASALRADLARAQVVSAAALRQVSALLCADEGCQQS